MWSCTWNWRRAWCVSAAGVFSPEAYSRLVVVCLLHSLLSMTACSGLRMMPECPANHSLDDCFLREGRRRQRRESVEWVGRRWLPPAPSLREKSRNSSRRYLCSTCCAGPIQAIVAVYLLFRFSFRPNPFDHAAPAAFNALPLLRDLRIEGDGSDPAMDEAEARGAVFFFQAILHVVHRWV